MIYGFRSMRQAIPADTEMSRSFAMGMLPFIAVYALAMALNFLSAWCLRRRKAWTFSVVVAGLDLIYFPLGTVLGIFTLIVLLRGSVRDAYDAPPV